MMQALAVDGAFTVKPEDILRHVHTNAAAPALVSQICLPFLENGVKKTIVHVSSTGGSLGSIERVGARLVSYGMSKTALNMLVRPILCRSQLPQGGAHYIRVLRLSRLASSRPNVQISPS